MFIGDFVLGTLKKDMGVGTFSRNLRDGVSQTENWIRSVSSKMIQTILQPQTDSGTQTMMDANANKVAAPQVSQLVQVNLPLLQTNVCRDNAETQTERGTSPTIAPPSTYRPIVFHRHVQTDVEVKVTHLCPPLPPRPLVLHRQIQTDREVVSNISQNPPSPVLRKPIVIHRQVQTESKLFIGPKEENPVAQKLDRQTHRKSIAIGDGAVNDVLCDRCINKRTRHASCGTDPVRPMSGVNVATQSYTTCQVSTISISHC